MLNMRDQISQKRKIEVTTINFYHILAEMQTTFNEMFQKKEKKNDRKEKEKERKWK